MSADYPFDRTDAETVGLDQVEVGDVLLSGGEPGTVGLAGRVVTFAGFGGWAPDWGQDVWRAELRGCFGEMRIAQPAHLPVLRLRRDMPGRAEFARQMGVFS